MHSTLGHDGLTYSYRLPEGFHEATLEEHIARGRLLHAKAVQQGFASAWQRVLHLFDARLGLSQTPKADQAV